MVNPDRALGRVEKGNTNKGDITENCKMVKEANGKKGKMVNGKIGKLRGEGDKW